MKRTEQHSVETERRHYDEAGLWGGELPESEQRRIAATVTFIPPDVRTILDVGCGDGRLTNRLSGYDTVGVDSSREALKYVRGKAVVGDILDLPFADASFDLVLSSEVLEHLPGDRLAPAAAELERVCGRYLLLSVPYRERLIENTTRCCSCGLVYHAHHHYQSFTRSRLDRLFRGARLVRHATLGTRPLENLGLLLVLRHLGRQWPTMPKSLCPRCGSRENGCTGNAVAWVAERIKWRLDRLPWKRNRDYWMLALYEKGTGV